MADEHAIARYRHWYRKLLRFYSRPYRERFAESMEQTFNDLCRERAAAGKGLFGFVLWVFVETSAGIMRENMTGIIMQNKNIIKNIIRPAIGTGLILLIPLVAMKFTEEVNWSRGDFFVMGYLLFGTGLVLEFAARILTNSTHRLFAVIAVVVVFLLIWLELAVGLFLGIGS